MNPQAAKELHILHKPHKGCIYIDPSLHGRKKRKVIVHEEIESYMMKHDHLHYKKAHKIANRFEKNIK